MFSTPLLILKESPRKVAAGVRTVMLGEDYVAADSAAAALRSRSAQSKQEGRLFVVSAEGDWTVLAEHDEGLSLSLGSAAAGEAAADGFFVQPGRGSTVLVYDVVAGQRAEDPAELKVAEAAAKLKEQGVHERLLSFVAKEHLASEQWKAGKHDDLVLGFHAADATVPQQTEVQRALSGGSVAQKKAKTLSLDRFLSQAIGNPRTRAIAKAHVEDQLKRDGFGGTLEFVDPQPEGHYCERFDAESFSFTTNGPYVWFDWQCDEACEPVHEAEQAFPDCTLRFELETSQQL